MSTVAQCWRWLLIDHVVCSVHVAQMTWTAKHGFKLLNENGEHENIANEIVITVTPFDEKTDRLDIHFGRREARAGFVGHRYAVNVPRRDISWTESPCVDFGYQFRGVLELKGTIVIDEPITRQKPRGDRAIYKAA